ncbi:MAG TPA: four helix bundle protein [Verrucomicrobiota bacterium]|mgnify:CR=1 FL=1|jgi:four helix bundle protein|nr:MAG: hypothetical protein BWX68_00008 [Verrucomicrobia bacterium ADurb.Bin063]HCL92550.1 hypothetical protein [Limisphaerales bacterium]HPC54154.1 four helix bundle protein [Verrucomicrobiota bacterium]HQE99272.1 four helix bundle protein [Anaerolineae bacterium]HPW91100.1 four helix bundle protein [Verrucomicrobiota bacterium]
MGLNSAKDLEVYKKTYQLAMRSFEISQRFPSEERYALASQIRRSSRSICLNLRKAWAKRHYEAHFISKLTDCDGENGETDSSFDSPKLQLHHLRATSRAHGALPESGEDAREHDKDPSPFSNL